MIVCDCSIYRKLILSTDWQRIALSAIAFYHVNEIEHETIVQILGFNMFFLFFSIWRFAKLDFFIDTYLFNNQWQVMLYENDGFCRIIKLQWVNIFNLLCIKMDLNRIPNENVLWMELAMIWAE